MRTSVACMGLGQADVLCRCGRVADCGAADDEAAARSVAHCSAAHSSAAHRSTCVYVATNLVAQGKRDVAWGKREVAWGKWEVARGKGEVPRLFFPPPGNFSYRREASTD